MAWLHGTLVLTCAVAGRWLRRLWLRRLDLLVTAGALMTDVVLLDITVIFPAFWSRRRPRVGTGAPASDGNW